MKRFLLQDASNAGWVKAQEARTQINTASAQIRLQAYPELSTKSRSSIDLKIAQEKVNQLQIRRVCQDIALSTIDMTLAQLFPVDDKDISRIRSKALHYNTLTWKERSVVIFYYLHPLLGNKDAEVTCRVFGVRHATFTNWVTKHSYYPKWVPFVEFMTVRTVLNSIPVEFRAIFDESQLDVESGVSIPVQFRTPTTKRYVTATSHPQLSRQKVVKIAKKSEGVKYLATSVRTFGNDGILGPPSEFCSVMKLNGGGISPALAQWVRRRLEGANWSIRKESVSQKVPTDWVLIALVASQKIRTKLDGCTVLINADEVFIKFFPRDTEFVMPKRDAQ
ncbi:hypothetical protein GN958_ATG10150 [Phytophthora infestans]|uniref:Uncharacterized protein n=1 Tax=Phytophthora infestans TaxID=4787 RepID=A0A8S9UJC5_PHYIN|nr:hypothetical protein GN958_ATG10148 [Phytophthora infestans]KAF4140658.1 hypothetical protein GN958_ATG10150 [Phytophthora infestans]